MKNFILIALLAGLLGLGGWYYLTEVHTTPIGAIYKSPRDFSGREIAISGTVTERFSLFVVRYFNLRDSSGSIVVVTDQPLPAVGSNIRIKGHVEEGFSLGDQQVLVFLENQL